jgi:hypothetical protein
MPEFPNLPAGDWPADVVRAYEFLRDAVVQGQELLALESNDAIRYCSAAERLSAYRDFRDPLIDQGLDEDWVDIIIGLCESVHGRLRTAGDEAVLQ